MTKKRKMSMRRKSKPNKTAAERAHIQAVKSLPCSVCTHEGPSDAHHVFHDRYSQKKASDFAVIPLCKDCHQNTLTSIHRNKKGWQTRHGPDWSYIPLVLEALGIDTSKDF